MNYAALGARVRRYRQEQKLTQEQLAETADISASFLGHIERGSRVLSIDTLLRLCTALRVTPNELLGMEFPNDPDEVHQQARVLLQATLDLLRRKLK